MAKATSKKQPTGSEELKRDTTVQRSYYVDKDLERRMKFVSLKTGKSGTQYVNEAFRKIVEDFEKKNGPISI